MSVIMGVPAAVVLFLSVKNPPALRGRNVSPVSVTLHWWVPVVTEAVPDPEPAAPVWAQVAVSCIPSLKVTATVIPFIISPVVEKLRMSHADLNGLLTGSTTTVQPPTSGALAHPPATELSSV
jgi:hypothetical protein